MTIGSWLDNLLGNTTPDQSTAPPQSNPYLLGGSPAFGVPQGASFGQQRPQLATPEEFQKNQNSLGSIIGSFANGTIPGLSRVFGGDPNATNAAYNAMLQQAQQTETGRLNLAPYEAAQQQQPQGAPPSPAMARAPGAFNDMDPAGTEKMLPPGLTGKTTPYNPVAFNDMDPSGIPQAGAAPFGAPQVPAVPGGGALDPRFLSQRIKFLTSFPGGLDAATKLFGVLGDLNKQGTSIDASGNQYRLGGANSANYERNLSESLGKNLQQIGANGVVSSLPGVIQDAAGKGGAIKGAETNAANLSNLYFEPQIKGATAAAELPSKVQLERSKFQDIKPEGALFDPLANGGQGGYAAHGQTREQITTGETLGKEYGANLEQAKAADTLRERIGYIMPEMSKAITGSLADQKYAVGKMLIGLGLPASTVTKTLGNVASTDVLQKEFYRLSTDQVKGLGREPGYILDKITSANPNIETQKEAMVLMTHAIDQGAARQQDKRDAQASWLADPAHHQSLAGFEGAFVKTHPPEMYVNRAYQRTDGVPENSQLVGTRGGNRVWQLQDGTRVMARH